MAAGVYLLLLLAGCEVTTVGWVASIVTIYGVGVHAATAMEREWGEDPGPVVIDEGLGYLVTVAWLPQTMTTALVAFFLFRALDIIKPEPARWSERLPGGWGIMTDDLIAGVYANMLIRAGLYAAAWWAV